MISVLFVDDESNVLDGLRRMLRCMRHQWDMVFADGGEAALKHLGSKHYDVVVSDMRMPGMDGVTLLKEVMTSHPRTIRLALSGHAEMEKILDAARVAHQYLAKPCDSETLISTIDRACSLRELFAGGELESVVGGIDRLPSLPSLYIELMDEIADPNSSINRVGEIIARDVSMCTKILQLVNSAFFGLNQHVESPAQAVSMLGLNTIKGLALTTKAFASFDSSSVAFDIEALWDHSSRVGTLSAQIAKLEHADKKVIDNAFISGMLHDIGKLVLATQLPERYASAVAAHTGESEDTVSAECGEFGCSHMEVGAYLINLWGFANPIVEALAFHHGPEKSVGNAFSPLTAVHIADALLNCDGDEAAVKNRYDLAYLDRLGLVDHAPFWAAGYEELFGENAAQ